MRVKWEYKLDVLEGNDHGESVEAYEKHLDAWGADGWELCGVMHGGGELSLHWKRPAEEPVGVPGWWVAQRLNQVGPHAEKDGYRIVVIEDDAFPDMLAQAIPIDGDGLSHVGAYRTRDGGVVLETREGRRIPASVMVALLKVAGTLESP